MADLDIRELQRLLSMRGAGWSASTTSFLDLSRSQRQRLMGVPETPLSAALQQASSSMQPAYPSNRMPPVRVDWRNNGGNWISPVRDQDLCRSCTAFAVCAVIESALRIREKNPRSDEVLAPSPLFFCGHPKGCAQGRLHTEVIDLAKTRGVGLERDAPYAIDEGTCREVAAVVRIVRARYVTGTARARKFAIAEEGPVYAEMRVFTDFLSYESGVYRHAMGDNEGLHAVAIVGYDDAELCWIAKNSWGSTVQEDGFFRIGYGECEIDARPFIAFDVERVETPAT